VSLPRNCRQYKLEELEKLTVTTESRAAIANISAHETTPGHTLSTADLILSTTSNPLAEFRFGAAFFSPLKLDVSSRRMEPSHPYIYIYIYDHQVYIHKLYITLLRML
jgi:hypothetical protein